MAVTRTRGGSAGEVSAGDGAPTAPLGTGKRTARRAPTWLPTGRGLVGGVLVVTAVAGVLVAHRAATQPPTTRYVVMTRDVASGDPVGVDDLGTIAAELPDDVGAVSGVEADGLIGRVARVPLHDMDLLREGDLFEPDRFTTPGTTEIALDLTPAQALLGTLQVGDRVDVLSTDPDGVGTTTVATDVLVSEVHDDDAGGIGATGTVRVRIGVADTASAESVVDASVRTEITLSLPAPGPTDDGGAP